MKYSIVYVVVVLAALYACNDADKPDLSAEKEFMKKADIAFSELSRQKGMKAAFLEYIDPAGVLLRPGYNPIVGRDARDYLHAINDSPFTLTWEPSTAEISSSGDLGFTYGIYTLQTKDTTMGGTYVSIWKKQADGRWKFVLDTGNPGTGKEK